MNDPLHQSGVEKIAGNLVTDVVFTGLAAAIGGLWAPLLPVLAKSLASGRQQQRVEITLREITSILESHSAQIETLTDEQYKLINETMFAVLQTTESEKFTYLSHAVKNALTTEGLQAQETIMLSRVVRDISAEEIKFLVRNFTYEGIFLHEQVQQSVVYEKVLQVRPSAPDSLLVSGLLSLGVLAPPETGLDSGTMRFTSIAAKLITLFR